MSIRNNLVHIKELIKEAERRYNRNEGSVKLLAVSKTKPVEDVIEAYNCGQRLFGENRVHEGEQKVPMLPSDAEFHMIGHLQSNKVNKACLYFSCIQSVDSLKLAKKIDNRCRQLDKTMNIYLDINISGEDSKSGFLENESFYSDVEEILKLENVKILGLMAIGAHVEDRKEIKESFMKLKCLLKSLQDKFPAFEGADLSMGMSGDFEEAIEMGSTMVRIGSSIFGAR